MLNAYLDFSSSLKIIYVFHVNTSKIPRSEYLAVYHHDITLVMSSLEVKYVI